MSEVFKHGNVWEKGHHTKVCPACACGFIYTRHDSELPLS